MRHFLLLMIVSTLGARASADLVTFQEDVDGYSSTVDTFIAEFTPDLSYGSDVELSTDLDFDKVNDPVVDQAQAFVRFDNIFGTGSFQQGVTVDSATLTLNGINESSTGSTLSVFRMLTAWDENSTWNSLGAGISRDDVEAASVADASVPGEFSLPTDLNFDVTATVQAWANGSSNFGWMIMIDSPDGVDIDSSESAGIAPLLTVNFQPAVVPEPSSFALIMLPFAFLSISRRRSVRQHMT